MKSVIFDYVGWMFVVAVVSGVLFYNMLSRTSVRKLRTAVLYGVVTGVMASFAMISAVLPIWLAAVSLLVTIAVIVWSMARWREATLADRRSLRLRSAVCATGLNLLLFWPMTRAFDAFRKGVPVVGAFQTQIAAIIAISAICFVWRTYFKRKRYRRRWILTDIIWGLLVVFAIISLLVSAVKAAPKSKSAKTKAAVETVGQGPIDTIKELFGKLLDSSDEEVVLDDESSVAAETESDDESVAAEVADESVVADIETEEKAETEREPIIVENAWFDFYNLSLQEDGVDENDFNFGPKPVDETVSGIAREHRERLRVDPALGAADIAWADALLGTRYLGEFYESCKHDWAKTINAAKERFMEDHEAYDEVLDAFMKMQAKAKVYVQDGEIMEDQMYMNPYTVDGYPDVIVLKTPNHKGKFLVYEYTIKGTGVVKVAYSIPCGFQPTDVQKVMNITPATEAPEKKPDTPKPQTAGKITPAPTPTPKPTAAPTPTPVPGGGSDPAKDPSKAPKENTERNDDPGTGKATNSGSGSTKSAAASDSQKASDGGSVEDYDRKVEQNRSANAGGGSSGGSSGSGSSGGQKSGGESNKPSQSVPKAKQDNNGDAGNGSGSIDKPTAKSEAAVSADTNQSVDASGSAGGIIGTPD